MWKIPFTNPVTIINDDVAMVLMLIVIPLATYAGYPQFQVIDHLEIQGIYLLEEAL